VLAFAVVAAFLFRSLTQPAQDQLPSALIGKPVPRIEIPPLDRATRGFGPRDLSAGRVTVINVFASWCLPCHSEAPVLAKLAGPRDFAFYGLVQKDTPAKVRAFLREAGNPFDRIALDSDGRASIEWGVYGVPETYVVDGRGIVRARIVGEITERILREQLLPAIAQAGTQ
ncbi:MAG TPA: DsbE family thiol:disulfide interchange protein, partial [Xanthobacteraceae bacterium]|nr:DsbE family thiol:disulfide interchange protein [Xanthobacteraceae bacterium]